MLISHDYKEINLEGKKCSIVKFSSGEKLELLYE